MQIHSVNSEGLQRLLLLVDQSHWLNMTKNSSQTTPPSHRFSPSSSIGSSSSKDNELKFSQSDSSKMDVEESEEGNENFETDSAPCPTCSKPFRISSDELCLHQNENSHFDMKQIEGVSTYLCPKRDCTAYFSSTLNVQKHYLEMHMQRSRNTVAISEKHVYKYRCNQCSLAFKTMEKLQLHSQYHFIREATKCGLCGRSFRTIVALQKHVETSHAELTEDEMMLFRQNLLNSQLMLSGLSGQVLDPSVTELLKKEGLRIDAEESMDEEGPNKEEDSSFAAGGGGENSDEEDETYKEQLIEDYLNSQTIAEENYNDPNRKYKCHKCKMAFTRQSYLTLHNKKVPHRKGEKVIYPMEKYLDPNRPYKCEVCKESFTQKNILLVHYNSVSHLHKLKRASQDVQNSSSGAANLSTSNIMISSTSNQLLPKSNSSSEDDEKKPYKCNICKVAYSQVTTLDIHMRSVLHQTRATKLQELALAGQIDVSKPLFEQPADRKKIPPEPYGTPTKSAVPSSPINDCSQGSQISSPNSVGDTSTTVSNSTSHSMLPCPRCNALFVNQEQLHAHQQLYCMFGSPMSMFSSLSSTSTAAAIPFSQASDQKSAPSSLLSVANDDSFLKLPLQAKKSSHMYKHLLESFGFDLVMQFNENHQRRQRKEREESERLLAELQSAQLMSEEAAALEIKKEINVEADKEEKSESPSTDELPEVSKSTCAHCNKEFSSVWVLKAHCEEVHKDLVPLDFLEKYAQQIKCEIEKKVVPGTSILTPATSLVAPSDNEDGNSGGDANNTTLSKSSGSEETKSDCPNTAIITPATTADVGTDTYSSNHEEQDDTEESCALNMSTSLTNEPLDASEKETEEKESLNLKMGSQSFQEPSATPNPPTACSTPASSTESIPPTSSSAVGGVTSPNLSMSLAQQMNEMQAALSAMAASQLQQLQPFNPMMMGMASLGMGLPLGLNMPALAAMNLQPPLVPMMMPPPSFDSIVGLGQAQNPLFSQQNANIDSSTILTKQQQHMMQQQQVVRMFVTFLFSLCAAVPNLRVCGILER